MDHDELNTNEKQMMTANQHNSEYGNNARIKNTIVTPMTMIVFVQITQIAMIVNHSYSMHDLRIEIPMIISSCDVG